MLPSCFQCLYRTNSNMHFTLCKFLFILFIEVLFLVVSFFPISFHFIVFFLCSEISSQIAQQKALCDSYQSIFAQTSLITIKIESGILSKLKLLSLSLALCMGGGGSHCCSQENTCLISNIFGTNCQQNICPLIFKRTWF